MITRRSQLVWLTLALLFVPAAAAAPAQDRVEQFKQLAADLVGRRHAGAEEAEAEQARAMELLDAVVLDLLNGTTPATLESMNRSLELLRPSPPFVGQEYRLLQTGRPDSPWYVLAANFGLAGPSAVRIYARSSELTGGYRLAARIDRFGQPEYFDEFLEVVQVAPADGVFVTVTGRTDERETGGFIAWRFDGARLLRLWSTDLLERSRYEVVRGEFRLTYCEETDEDDPSKCARTLRERHAWRAGEWHLLERREEKP